MRFIPSTKYLAYVRLVMRSYLKYLTKKFLGKHSLRDYLRVVATKKDAYEIKYYGISNEEETTA